MNTKFPSDRGNLTYKYYIKQPFVRIDIKINMIISKNPHLTNSLDGSINQPISRKISNIHLKFKKCM